MTDRPRLGISACLLGEHVRYDAGHKRDAYLVETFGRFVEWVPFCPEVEAGFGTPREPIRLVARTALKGRGVATEEISVISRSGLDVTSQLKRTAARLAREVEEKKLAGFVLKKKSPSCGLERVTIYDASNSPIASSRGVFATALTDRLPVLPVEEEGRLTDPVLRENFVERVFAYQRLRELFERRWSLGDLVRFHTTHKLTLMAHSPEAYRRIGRLVASARAGARQEIRREYEAAFMTALKVVATRKRHANVLAHMLGYFKKTLDADSRAELASTIEEYRQGQLPLIVPLTLFKHHIRRVGVPYLADQVYLDPHPRELALRNQV